MGNISLSLIIKPNFINQLFGDKEGLREPVKEVLKMKKK
jgi:hypothetical protein